MRDTFLVSAKRAGDLMRRSHYSAFPWTVANFAARLIGAFLWVLSVFQFRCSTILMQLPEPAATDYCKISFTLPNSSAALEEPMPRFQTVFAARERPGAFRYDGRVDAAIAFGDKTPSIECMIRDISQTGAMLEVDPSVLPDDFTLVFSR